jgi:hypothetical protein
VSKSDKQRAVDLEADLREEKEKYAQKLQKGLEELASKTGSAENKKKLLLKLHREAVALFNKAEQSVADTKLLLSHSGEEWVLNKAETSLAFLSLIPSAIEIFRQKAQELGFTTSVVESMTPDETAYASLQRIVASHFPAKADELRRRWAAAGLPTFGFDNPFRSKRTPLWVKVSGLFFGGCTFFFLMALIICGLAGVSIQQDTKPILVLFFAFGCALSTAFLGGFAIAEGKIKVPVVENNTIKFSAGGGIAVLVVVLLLGYWIFV